MLGFEGLLKRSRWKADRPLETEERPAASTDQPRAFAAVQAPETKAVLQQAAMALEKLQDQQKAVSREMTELREMLTRRLDQLDVDSGRKQNELDCLHLMTSWLLEAAVDQRDAISHLAAGAADRSDEMDRMRRAVATVSRTSPAALEIKPVALLGAPRSRDPEIVPDDDACDPHLDRLNGDKDVVRFRKHMEFVMAAAGHTRTDRADPAPSHRAPVLVLARSSEAHSLTAA